MFLRKILLIKILFFSLISSGQTDFEVILSGLKVGDSASVTIKKSSEALYVKWAKSSDGSDVVLNYQSLSEGKWSLSVDATGYTYPTAKIINIPGDVSAKITLTEMISDGKYKYSWNDDDSSAGHNTQSYFSEPTEIKVLDKTVKVPNDYSSIFLRNRYGIILSNENESWSIEDSYRLFKTFSMLPFEPYDDVDFSNGKNIRGIFKLTNQEQYRDITVESSDGNLKNVVISKRAFTYASPQIVTIDGIKGKFYSKRLYHAVVNYLTDFGENSQVVNEIADKSFGLKFMESNQETEDLMNEDSSNFQSFTAIEKIEILSMLEELPEGFHRQEGLKFLVRRINGQNHPLYTTAAAIAWTGNADYLENYDPSHPSNTGKAFTIEFMSKAFTSGSLNDIRRLILHEKAHFLWEYTFDESLKDDWIEVAGWFEDPTTASGWSTYNTTEFVSPYAHLKNPNEDMAESIALYLTNPDKLLNVSIKKYEFIRDRVMHGTRYVAQIREDLTFTVYNLFPEYTFPGKVIGIELEVEGDPDGDKKVSIKAKLNSENFPHDGASQGTLRFVSTVGTIHDISIFPENGQSVDSILVGEGVFNKYEKAGYWTLQSFITIDPGGNTRFENTSTVGMKLFMNNVDEDKILPVWNYDIEFDVVKDKFTPSLSTTNPDENGEEMHAIKINSTVYDNKKMDRIMYRFINPTIDSATGDKLESGDFIYERSAAAYPKIDSLNGLFNNYDSNKHFETYMAVPDYFPSGYYSVSYIDMFDLAGNGADVFFVKDTADMIIPPERKLINYKDVRDSVYVKTEYPDYRRPEIDINNINISAEPTKPEAPDGETRVNITLMARDISDFPGKEAGISIVEFVLRDPIGGDHGFQTGNGTMVHPELDKTRNNPTYDGNGEWKAYDFNLTLPQGSPPGQWGIAEAYVMDKAGNKRMYSFVEYVRFDVIESDIVLTSPLEVEILDKFINAKNVDSISAKMSCVPCKDLNYVYTIYSRMGGGGAVVRGEGKFESDTIVVNNIKTSGVLDGLVNLTVQLTDTTSAHISTKTAQYLKDVVYPKSYYARSNIQDQGWSNIDNMVVQIEVESEDVGGTYNLNISNYDNNRPSSLLGSSDNFSQVSLTGLINESKFDLIKKSINFEKLSSLQDGYIVLNLVVTDSVGNIGDPTLSYYMKKNSQIMYIGNELDSQSDDDGDGFIFSEDNSPFFYNPRQEDIDNDGIGDWSDNSTILTSISETFKSDTINFSNNILSALKKIYNVDRVVEKIGIKNINDSENHITIDTIKKTFYVSQDKSLNFFTKHIYDYKIGVHSKLPSESEIDIDSLDLRIYVDRYNEERVVETQKTKISNNLIEHKLINPYQIDQSDQSVLQSFFDKYGNIPSGWNGPDFETNAYFKDLNKDGYNDMIIGDYRVDAFGLFMDINHVSDPVYLTHDGSFNFKSSYNNESNNEINKSIIHSPNLKILADLNNDGIEEIINFGEEYHHNYPPHHPHINYIIEWFKTKDLQYGIDYNEHGKKTRYYSINNNGEIVDQVSKIDISKTDSFNPNYLRNMFSGTAGDIDNDGDIDLISAGVYWNDAKGGSYDIIKNDGSGNLVLESQQFSTKHYTGEGHMMIMDIDGDDKNDVVFGGRLQNNERSIFAFFKGNGTNVDFENPIILEEMHPSLTLRSVYYEDINGDSVKELITYFTNGFGTNGYGLTTEDIPNFVKIYELDQSDNTYLKDVSDKYFNDSQNMMNFYSQTSFMQYLDLDGDGYKDLVPKFSLEDPEVSYDYPGNAYRGDWNDSKGFQYFKFNNTTKKYDIIDLGLFNELYHYNNFDFADLNNDNSLEWIAHYDYQPEDVIYIYEYYFDLDNDGVFDKDDQCPDTPENAIVDVTGCEIFDLPVNNYRVEVSSATCIGNSDGVIDLSIEDATFDYTVTVTGVDDVSISGDSKTASVENLTKGTYNVCFKVTGQDDYEQCFEVVVGEPPALSAYINIDNDLRSASINMSGSDNYIITINGFKQRVVGDVFESSLSTGLNIIRVHTDLDCQGFVEKEVFISEDIHYYPNPTERDVNVHVGGDDNRVKVSVFSEKGDLIYSRYQDIAQESRKTKIDLNNQTSGAYIVVLESKTVRKTFKILRE